MPMRKNRYFAGLIASLMLLILPPAGPVITGEAMKSSILEGLKVHELKIQPPSLHTKDLDGKALLLSAPDPSLPFLTLELYFYGGTSIEPPERKGSLDALTSLMQIGGAGNLGGDELAEELARLGIQLSVNSNYEYWSIKVTSLKGDFDRAFEILTMVLLEPRFPADRLEVIKDSFRTKIKQRNDDPAAISRRKMAEALFPGFSIGQSIQFEDIDRLSVDLLRDELARRLSTQNLMISVSGDYKENELIPGLKKLIDQFPANNSNPKVEPFSYEANGSSIPECSREIILVDFSANQAAITIGGYMPPHNHEDFFAIQTGNYILGGGSFNSRMMREIRAKRGLAYYAYSGNNFYEKFGQFLSASGTRVDQADLTLELMLSIIGDMSSGVEENELSLAKDAILNSLVFQYEDPEKYVSSEVRFRRHHMPADYLNLFPREIGAVTSERIAGVSKKYLNPEEFCIVVTGPADQLKGKLEHIRPVRVIQPEDTVYK